jgi:DNA-directed RNA polymerase subunit RPC12/RpoP
VRIGVSCPGCARRQQVAAAQALSETTCRRCGRAIALALTEAVREDREVDACPVCEGRDFYVRRDLNRSLGLTVVIIVGLVSAGFLWSGRDLLAYGVLGAFALVDFVIYQLLKDVTVCYRCQAEFRGSYPRTARPFDLHTAEEMELEYSRRLEAGPGVRSRSLPR